MIKWENIKDNCGRSLARTKVFGGWLVLLSNDVYTLRYDEATTGYEWRESLTFVPDPNHEWVIE